jgi:hypothetical protein
MAVDETLMNDFCGKHQTSKKDLKEEIREKFRYYWNTSFTKKKGIPKFLGLIAIQIYEASLMQNEKKFSAREYNPRLEKYLDVSQGQLQVLYANYQDNLWHKLEIWADEEGFNICIPEIGLGAGRYTQYPLSQALLNQEDLKQIPLLFQNAGLKPNEYLSFKSFIKLIQDSDYNVGLPSHYYRIKWRLQEQRKEHLLYHQLFGYFNEKWDGTCPGEIEKKNSKQNGIEKNKTNLIINNERTELYIVDQDFNDLFKCTLENIDLFKSIKKYYNPFHKEILIFTEDKSYDEWVDCRYLETNHNHIVICKKYSSAESFVNNLDSNCVEFKFKHFLVFKVSLGEKRSNHFYWKPFFNPQPKNYAIGNGLKLSRKTWMVGAGPNINFFEKTDAWINGERISFEDDNLEISCRNFEVGTYRLKVKSYPPEKIEILKPSYIPESVNSGWKINQKVSLWQSDNDNYQISGFLDTFPTKTEQASVRNWVAALTQKSNESQNSAVVINAIKQSKYGL